MQLLSIFVGRPKAVTYQGRTIETSIFKDRIEGPVKVGRTNIEGDQQSDLSVHGGPTKAVYAYPAEYYDFWRAKRPDLSFAPGSFGENLSITGLDDKTVYIGDVYKIGSAVFQVTSPRMPCLKLGIKMGDPSIIQDFNEAERPGFYFSVIEEGLINDGDRIEVVSKDPQELSIVAVASLYGKERWNKDLLQSAIENESLPEDWRAYFRKRLASISS